MKRLFLNLSLLVCAVFSIQALTPYRYGDAGGARPMFPKSSVQAVVESAPKVTVAPAPGDVLSLQSFDVTFPEAAEVAIGDLNYGNAPYVCEKGSDSHNWCFNTSAAGNVLTVAMTSEVTALGEYELHLPAGFYNIDGTASTEELVFDYKIVETLSDGILREAPAGTKVECMTRYASFFPDYGGDRLWCWPILGKPAHYILGEDGNLYIYNPIVTAPFSNKPIMSYIKAENIDGKYIAKFPQAIFQENFKDKDEIMYLNLAKHCETAYEIVEAENNQVEFVIEDDVLKALIPEGEEIGDYALATFTGEGVWSYYANYQMWLSPFKDTAATPPSDGIINDWEISYSLGGVNAKTTVSVIINDDEIWIKGISQNIPDAWAHGEIDGDKVYFDKYLGLAESVGQYIYLFRCSTDEDVARLEDLVFNYNPALKTLTLIGYQLIVNPNPWMYYALELYENPVIKPLEETPLTTKTPKPIQGFDAFYPQSDGSVSVQIRVNTENTAGEVLPSQKLFYEILRDDESVYVFSPDNYSKLTEPMSMIPVNYQKIGVIWCSGAARTFTAYLEPGEENMGARMVYRDDTDTYYSETVWVNRSDSIGEVAENLKCVSVQYFDISGREVQNPANGVYLKKETFSNGEARIQKICKSSMR